MKESVKTVYECDYCSKKYFREHACKNHEIKCGKNPENIRACFNCMFLEQVSNESEEIHFINGGDFDTRYEKVPTYFKCTKLNKNVYFPKAEHIGLLVKYPDHFEDQEPMPKQCDSFKGYTFEPIESFHW